MIEVICNGIVIFVYLVALWLLGFCKGAKINSKIPDLLFSIGMCGWILIVFIFGFEGINNGDSATLIISILLGISIFFIDYGFGWIVGRRIFR